MFADDKTLEAVLNRYKLGLDQVQASREAETPFTLHPSWRDRFFFSLGKHAATSAAYHPAYPAS